MKIIVCKKCGHKIRIPDDKHIYFKCPQLTCRKEYEYNNGEPVDPPDRNYLIPLAACLLAGIGSFFSYLFPVPILAGLAWIVWWNYKVSKRLLAKTASGLALSTAFGLTLLLLLQLIINIADHTNSIAIPNLLLQLDNFLIWARVHLTSISEISLGAYALIVGMLLYLAMKKPAWKPVSKFVSLSEWLGRVTAVLVVITSFTFFATSVSSETVNKGLFRHYKIAYREELKQERKTLIAHALKEELGNTDTTDYVISGISLYKELEPIQVNSDEAETEAKQDANDIMAYYKTTANENDFYIQDEHIAAETDADIKKKWEEEIRILSRAQNNPGQEIQKDKISANKVLKINQATTKANEAVEAVKAVFGRIFGSIIPVNETWTGKYIETFIDAIAEYSFDAAKIQNMIYRIFDHTPEKGKINLFSKLGNFRAKVKTDRNTRVKNANIAQANSKFQLEKDKVLPRLAEMDKWESIRQKMFSEIDNIKCPAIHQNEQFRDALTEWQKYLVTEATDLNSQQAIEDAFWKQARSNHTLLEAFARGIMWYKSNEITGTFTIKDALDHYQKTNNIPSDIYNRYVPKSGGLHACPHLK